jgi:hypothetical protein
MKTRNSRLLAYLVPALLLSRCWHLNATDIGTATQTKAIDRSNLSQEEMAQRHRARQQFADFQAHAKAAAESRRAEIAARLTKMVPAHLVAQYDANGNGLIDPDEWRKYRLDVDKQIAALRQAREAANNSTASPPTNK